MYFIALNYDTNCNVLLVMLLHIYYVKLYCMFQYIILLYVLVDCFSEKNAAYIFDFANFLLVLNPNLNYIHKYCFNTILTSDLLT
jgi:hypothetical protein